jgi:hypothetical protein
MTNGVALTAHLCGLGMGMATIVSLVPAMVNMMRMINP